MQRHRKRVVGVLIRSVSRSSPFYRAGLRRGDRIVAVNGEQIESDLDFYFFSAHRRLLVTASRQGKTYAMEIMRTEGTSTGVTLAEQPIRRCVNRCIFCFIDQMPRGLRRSLYVKDEDVRLSLISGNYVTLSSFRRRDLEHLARIGLSPLYVSVHATDDTLRRRMLGNPNAPDIMEQLEFLATHDIRFHAQIVVCPSYNDGKALERTMRDLLTLKEALCSVAVVPVGLTRFRAVPLRGIDREAAAVVCRRIGRISDLAARSDGVRKVFLADEFFIKARLPVPEASYYEEYPQLENGVGLLRRLLDSWEEMKNALRRHPASRRHVSHKKRLLLTSVSAAPFLEKIIDEMKTLRPALCIDVAPVCNRFFGETITVAGLLTASDILREVKKRRGGADYGEVTVPAVIFNYAGYTLDGFSKDRLGRALGIPVRAAESLRELIDS
ncbi:MAG: DUF512 domain-containing protein [Chitinispirillaceae bacterium]|nr:DUF512 domain-containing protein [Chitinispirillaceae bacterium]